MLEQFVDYIGTTDSLNGYIRSNRLVLLKSLFSLIDIDGKALVSDVVLKFKEFYFNRKINGLVVDKEADKIIENIESATLSEVLTVIKRHPYRVLNEKKYLFINEIDGEKYFIFSKYVVAELTETIKVQLIDTIEKKIVLYFNKLENNEQNIFEHNINVEIVADCCQNEQANDEIENDLLVETFTDYVEFLKQNIISMEQYFNLHRSVVTFNNYDMNIINKRSDIFYKCTTCKGVLVKWIIDVIAEMFEQTQEENIEILDVYNNLQNRFKFHSINRKNLYRLLCTTDILKFRDFQKLQQKYLKAYNTIIDGYSYRTFPEFQKKFKLDNGIKNVINGLLDEKIYEINGDIFLNDNGKEFEKIFKNAIDDLGKDICIEFIQNPDIYYKLIKLLRPLTEKMKIKEKNKKVFLELLNNININNNSAKLCDLLYAYTPDEETRQVFYNILSNIKDVCGLFTLKNKFTNDLKEIFPFLKWLSNDLKETIYTDFENIFKKDTQKEIFSSRSIGATLEATGQKNSVTRERIRQIERKVMNYFNSYMARKKPHYICLAFSKDESIISNNIINEIFNENAYLFIYALKNCNAKNLMYDEDIDRFIVGSDAWRELLDLYVDELPQQIFANDFDDEILNIFDNMGYPINFETVKNIVLQEYDLIGNLYTKNKMTKKQMYHMVIDKYFKSGINVFNEYDIAKFKQCFCKMFGEIGNTNERALATRICSGLILCDRGKYILPQYINFDEDLYRKIKYYILNSTKNTFLFHELYEQFKEELSGKMNVNNRYFMQGTLKYLYGTEFTFSKDTVSKFASDGNGIDIEIENYIKEQEFLVNKDKLKSKFVGITEATLGIRVSNNKNILLWGMGIYLHSTKIIICTNDIDRLRETLENYVGCGTVSTRKIFDEIYIREIDFLTLNQIDNHIALFSLLEYLFYEDYEFSRPNIASKNTVIASKKDMILQFLDSCDQVSLTEFKEYLDDNRIIIMNFTNLLEEISNHYARVNEDTLIKTENVNVDAAVILEIEEVLMLLMGNNGYISAKNIDDFFFFPSIGVKWNTYLLIFIIKKFSTKIKVFDYQKDWRYIRDIFVKQDLCIYDYESLLQYAIKAENNYRMFVNVNEIEVFLKTQGLISNNIPDELFNSGFITIDSITGNLRIE